MGCAVADYDNDGDPDLYITNYGPNVLYRNEGGAFAPAKAGVDLDGWSTSATFGDYDLDGDLDLYVAQYLDFEPVEKQALLERKDIISRSESLIELIEMHALTHQPPTGFQ